MLVDTNSYTQTILIVIKHQQTTEVVIAGGINDHVSVFCRMWYYMSWCHEIYIVFANESFTEWYI